MRCPCRVRERDASCARRVHVVAARPPWWIGAAMMIAGATGMILMVLLG